MNADMPAQPAALCELGALRAILARLERKRVTLMGLGVFGGGEGAARFLADSGAYVTVTDLKPARKLAATINRLGDRNIRYELGRHCERDFVETDLVVASPAVPRTSPFLVRAAQASVPITSPMNIFLALCPAPVVGITGTNGKSTTASMTAAMLERAGHRAWLGGNIGGSLLAKLGQIHPQDTVVLELSSFQLEDAAALPWSPHLAVVTNLSPNHLNRHGTFRAYEAAKKNIAAFQGPEDTLILNACDELLLGWADDGFRAQKLFFDARSNSPSLVEGMSLCGGRMVWRRGTVHEVICARQAIPLPGHHNVENALAAAAAARQMGASAAHIAGALRRFRPLEHRMEFVGEIGGIQVFDDSQSTTPESTIAAIRSMRKPITLIAGGYDKKLPLEPLAVAIAESVEVLVSLGQTGPALAQKTREAGMRAGICPTIQETASLPEALEAALRLSMPGSVLMFSPACASYDMFENCDQRGELFKLLVRSHPCRSAPSTRTA